MTLKNGRHCIVIVILVVLLHSVESHRILAVMPFSSTSHKNILVPLISALAHRGHQLVFITCSKTEELQNNSNVTEIIIDVEYEFSTRMNEKNNSKPFFERIIEQPTRTRWNFLTSFKGVPDSILNSTLKDSRVQDLMTNDHFDLVLISMVTTYIGYPFAWHFQCPFILISPNVAFSYVVSTMGDSEHPEYIPNMLSKLTDKMTLLERIQNTLLLNIFMYMPKYALIPGYNKIIRQYLPDFPSVLDVEKNISLLFTNTHPSINYPRASPPGMIEVGALHCRPAKKLKPNFEEFINGSGEDGFIMFAIGSVIQMNEMPPKILETFLRSFAKLPQRVIWQWKNFKKDVKIPSNILLSDWLPQQDILGHPKCKGFLTHGGLLSTQEAVYHGVPVIGLPFVTDQQNNMAKSVRDGYAVQLDWSNVDEEELDRALDSILHDPKYQISVKRLQSLLRDQPETPMERAIFWTEYAIRHNGAPALSLASRHLNWIQRNLIDVYLLITISFLTVLLILYFLMRLLLFAKLREKQKSA